MAPKWLASLKGEGIDRVGAVASSLCAAHCAACALLPAVLGALGLGALLGSEVEWIFTLVAVGFAAVALVIGWRSHKSTTVALLLTLGIVGLFASRGIESMSGHHHGEGHHGHVAEHDEHHDEPHKESHDEHHDDKVKDGQEHHAEAHHKDQHKEHDKEPHHDEPHHDEHGDEHEDGHDGVMHLAGSATGILAGLMLLLGHIMNLRATRRCKEGCA